MRTAGDEVEDSGGGSMTDLRAKKSRTMDVARLVQARDREHSFTRSGTAWPSPSSRKGTLFAAMQQNAARTAFEYVYGPATVAKT